MHGRDAGAVAEVGDNYTTACRSPSRDASQLAEEVLARQAVKPVTTDTLAFEAAGNRQQLRDSRELMVECGIKAGDLRHLRKAAMKSLGQENLLRQVFRIERAELMQLAEHPGGDALPLPI